MKRLSAHTSSAESWQHVVTAPLFLLPGFGIIALAGIWVLTLSLINSGNDTTIRLAQISSQQQAETYEAQVVRALREIDQTLLFIQYAHDHASDNYLAELNERSILPPALLFFVSIADEEGRIVYSNRPEGLSNVAGETYFARQRQADVLSVSKPQHLNANGPFYVHFSRRLSSPENEFDGIAIVSVEADYFVSSYESNLLGNEGLLAILDKDGVFIARRSGDTISVGDITDYSRIRFSDVADDDLATTLTTNPWDGVERFTSAFELFQFPLAVIVGLSAQEQLSEYHRNRSNALIWAGTGSLVLITVLSLLGYQSHQLTRVKQQALDVERANSARIEKMALHDALTGLPNRTLFSQLVSQSLHQAKRSRHGMAVIFLDLDHFKDINDSLGHDAGDDMLKETARRLKACLRESDTVSRFGGDEFVALMPVIKSPDDASEVGQKIVDTIAAPYLLKSQTCNVTASVGIALYPDDGEDEETLTRKADSAMYSAKQEGRNRYRFYSKATGE